MNTKVSPFTETVLKLVEKTNNVYPTIHQFRDQYTAMYDHMHNMINTYGTAAVKAVVVEMIEAGDFDEKD